MGNLNSLPVLLIAFNRPSLTKVALERIARMGPTIFFYSVDGPRENNTDDLMNVELCKNLIQDLSWNCKVYTNFAQTNFGSGVWPHKSINWAFNHVDKLLILEDDVLISEDFYTESNKLLDVFNLQKEIFSVCASNLSDLTATEQSNDIFFSKYFSGWGWATWSDRWAEYQYDITKGSKIDFFKLFKANNGNVFISFYFLFNFYLVKRQKIQAWDYQVNHLLFSSDKYVIKFKKNLSSNLGVGNYATHTKYLPKIQVNMIDGSYDTKIQTASIPEEEKRWRKSRIQFILESWLLRIRNFEKNTAH
jgi:hypothetical protein